MLIVKRRCAWYNKCMKESSKKFNLRYSLIQGSYWALSGIIFGFTAVYLQGKQYTNYDIGIIFALGNIVGGSICITCAQNAMGEITVPAAVGGVRAAYRRQYSVPAAVHLAVFLS